MRKGFRIGKRGLTFSLLALLAACGGALPEDSDELQSALSRHSARWVALGGSLNPNPADFVLGPSLAGGRRAPVITYSTEDRVTFEDKTLVSRWNGSEWLSLGQPFPEVGPSIATDSHGRILVCTANNKGPFVRRWDGSSFVPLGGDISEETGYKSLRYQVSSCSGIVLDSSDTPSVVWVALVGVKAHRTYAARWNRQLKKWDGLGTDGLGGTTEVSLDIDLQDRLYVATHWPGGSLGGVPTTYAWRWNGDSWQQLGAAMPATDAPIIGVYENTAYLALKDNASGSLRVMHWRHDAWNDLPSPGLGNFPSLGFTPSGKLVVAYTDTSLPTQIQVKYLAGRHWKAIGTSVSDVTDKRLGHLSLSLDAAGRPTVAWSQQDSSNNTGIFVKRYSAALP